MNENVPLSERVALVQEAALIFGMKAARQLMERLGVPAGYETLIAAGPETVH